MGPRFGVFDSPEVNAGASVLYRVQESSKLPKSLSMKSKSMVRHQLACDISTTRSSPTTYGIHGTTRTLGMTKRLGPWRSIL